MKHKRWVTTGLMIGLSLVAFVLRAYHPLSRPEQWLYRANAFNTALDARDWQATFQSYHPGYTTMAIGGAHRNYLLGGNRSAVQVVDITGHNEGITYIAEYLDQQPKPHSLRVGITHVLYHSMIQYFPGKILYEMTPDVDYYVFSRVAMQRHFLLEQWGPAWESVQARSPQMVVSYDGIDYLWLYAVQPPSEPVQTITIRRGGGTAFVVLAWGWAALMASLAIWAFRRPLRPRRQ